MLAPVRGAVEGARWRVVDTAGPEVPAELAGVDVLVWVATCTDLAQALDPPVRRPARGAAARRPGAHAGRLRGGGRPRSVVTSAEVFGAFPDNEVPLPDHAPARAVSTTASWASCSRSRRLVEESRANHPDVRFTLVRPPRWSVPASTPR